MKKLYLIYLVAADKHYVCVCILFPVISVYTLFVVSFSLHVLISKSVGI